MRGYPRHQVGGQCPGRVHSASRAEDGPRVRPGFTHARGTAGRALEQPAVTLLAFGGVGVCAFQCLITGTVTTGP